MTTCLGNSCSFGLLCMSFVSVCQVLSLSFPFWFEGGMWDLVVFIPDHYSPALKKWDYTGFGLSVIP